MMSLEKTAEGFHVIRRGLEEQGKKDSGGGFSGGRDAMEKG